MRIVYQKAFQTPKNWLNWNGALDNANESEHNWEADNESDMELDNGRENAETPEQRNVSATLNVSGLIRPTRRTKMEIEKALMMINIM